MPELDGDIGTPEDGEIGEPAIAVTPTAIPAETPEEIEERKVLTENAAKARGWKPLERYGKDPATWVDAETFLKRGEAFQQTQQKRIEALEAELKAVNEAKARFAESYEDMLERRDAEYKTALSGLKTQRNEAIRNGEDADAQLIEDQIAALDQTRAELLAKKNGTKQQQTTAAQQEEANQALLRGWVAKGNGWFIADSQLSAHAMSVGQQLRNAGETSVGEVFLNKVAEKVKADFPHKFAPAPVARPAGQVAGDGGHGAALGGKTKRDLPQADRDLLDLYVRQGLTTEQKFLKNYFG